MPSNGRRKSKVGLSLLPDPLALQKENHNHAAEMNISAHSNISNSSAPTAINQEMVYQNTGQDVYHDLNQYNIMSESLRLINSGAHILGNGNGQVQFSNNNNPPPGINPPISQNENDPMGRDSFSSPILDQNSQSSGFNLANSFQLSDQQIDSANNLSQNVPSDLVIAANYLASICSASSCDTGQNIGQNTNNNNNFDTNYSGPNGLQSPNTHNSHASVSNLMAASYLASDMGSEISYDNFSEHQSQFSIGNSYNQNYNYSQPLNNSNFSQENLFAAWQRNQREAQARQLQLERMQQNASIQNSNIIINSGVPDLANYNYYHRNNSTTNVIEQAIPEIPENRNEHKDQSNNSPIETPKTETLETKSDSDYITIQAMVNGKLVPLKILASGIDQNSLARMNSTEETKEQDESINTKTVSSESTTKQKDEPETEMNLNEILRNNKEYMDQQIAAKDLQETKTNASAITATKSKKKKKSKDRSKKNTTAKKNDKILGQIMSDKKMTPTRTKTKSESQDSIMSLPDIKMKHIKPHPAKGQPLIASHQALSVINHTENQVFPVVTPNQNVAVSIPKSPSKNQNKSEPELNEFDKFRKSAIKVPISLNIVVIFWHSKPQVLCVYRDILKMGFNIQILNNRQGNQTTKKSKDLEVEQKPQEKLDSENSVTLPPKSIVSSIAGDSLAKGPWLEFDELEEMQHENKNGKIDTTELANKLKFDSQSLKSSDDSMKSLLVNRKDQNLNVSTEKSPRKSNQSTPKRNNSHSNLNNYHSNDSNIELNRDYAQRKLSQNRKIETYKLLKKNKIPMVNNYNYYSQLCDRVFEDSITPYIKILHPKFGHFQIHYHDTIATGTAKTEELALQIACKRMLDSWFIKLSEKYKLDPNEKPLSNNELISQGILPIFEQWMAEVQEEKDFDIEAGRPNILKSRGAAKTSVTGKQIYVNTGFNQETFKGGWDRKFFYRCNKYDCAIKNNCSIKLGHTNQFKHILLLSIPGSGNTWTRQLIETTTGYATGSIFPDSKLYNHGDGLIGEVKNPLLGKTIVIKNHGIGKGIDVKFRDRHDFENPNRSTISGCIFVIRNPIDAIKSDFTRRTWDPKWIAEFNFTERFDQLNKTTDYTNTHIGHLNPEYFKTDLWPLTKKLLIDQIDMFGNLIPNEHCHNNVHFIQYEKLKLSHTYLVKELRNAVNFIKDINRGSKIDIKFRDQCLLDESLIEGKFHRVKNNRNGDAAINLLSLFTTEEKQTINQKLKKLDDFLKNSTVEFRVPEYYFVS